MTKAAGPVTRNAERTRRALLDAATHALAERGGTITLNEIASVAGVSKSGLLHHFPTREDLFLAVADHCLKNFRREVFRFIDLAENRPGKTLRAYVRALCGGSTEAACAFNYYPIWGALDGIPGVAEALENDYHEWTELFTQDGLHPDRVLIVRHAVDGLVGATLYAIPPDGEIVHRAREMLFHMIDDETWQPAESN